MFLKYFFVILLLKIISQCSVLNYNNMCKTFQDYYHPNSNENCYYEPDMLLETSELIEKYASNVEIHKVISQDGYILTMFRIPKINPKGVLLLHHSIATHSRIYLWQGNLSLAFSFWHAGYDVWLANQRGTSVSDEHVNTTSSNFNYWNFSFHEMGLYDVSSEIEYIRSKTNGSKIIFIGHSLGSTVGLVYSSLKTMEAKKYLKSMILLAAPGYLKHFSGLINFVRRLGPLLKFVTDTFRIGSPLILLPYIVRASRIVLRLFPSLLIVTCGMVWALCGYTPEETDPTFFNYDGTIFLNNFSWKTILHFLQIVNNNGKLQQYDYGVEENLKIYGHKVAPFYPLDKISIPVLLVSSANDGLISIRDSEVLFEELPPKARIYGHLKLVGLNHLDYYNGLHRKEIFVDKLIEFLNKM